jgi:hypothetical protein
MFKEHFPPDALKRPMLKWLLLSLTVLLVGVVLISVFSYASQDNQASQNQPMDQTTQTERTPDTESLSNDDEATLQQQIQEIIAQGKDADCPRWFPVPSRLPRNLQDSEK